MIVNIDNILSIIDYTTNLVKSKIVSLEKNIVTNIMISKSILYCKKNAFMIKYSE